MHIALPKRLYKLRPPPLGLVAEKKTYQKMKKKKNLNDYQNGYCSMQTLYPAGMQSFPITLHRTYSFK